MAATKYSPELREQAVRLVRDEIANGAPSMAAAVRQVGQYLKVSPDTLRRWVRDADGPILKAAPAESVAPPIEKAPAPAEGAAPVYAPQTSKAVQRVVIAVSVIAALVLGTFAFRSTIDDVNTAVDKADPSGQVDDYVAGKGTHDFYASDSRFRATFPFGMPKRTSTKKDVGGTPLEFVSYATENADQAFLVSTFELAAGAPFDLNASVNGSAVGVGGTVTSSTITKFQGFDAAQFAIAKGTELSIDGLVVRTPTRVYILQVIGAEDPSKSFEAFKRSFQIVTT